MLEDSLSPRRIHDDIGFAMELLLAPKLGLFSLLGLVGRQLHALCLKLGKLLVEVRVLGDGHADWISPLLRRLLPGLDVGEN